jgi:AcrR family transcriptional regulator
MTVTINQRKEREREEMRELILNAANGIIKTEGINGLSIRKIAKLIDYSPAIIYHYFSDKDAIINHIMKEGYGKIINALASVKIPRDEPEKRLKELTRSYINVALEMSEEYKFVQLNSSPEILQFTASLFKGASNKKPALNILFQCLKDIFKDKNMDDSAIELTAQIISTATFGLIIKLIIENVDDFQKTKLIEQHMKCIIDGMVLGKTLNNF